MTPIFVSLNNIHLVSHNFMSQKSVHSMAQLCPLLKISQGWNLSVTWAGHLTRGSGKIFPYSGVGQIQFYAIREQRSLLNWLSVRRLLLLLEAAWLLSLPAIQLLSSNDELSSSHTANLSNLFWLHLSTSSQRKVCAFKCSCD